MIAPRKTLWSTPQSAIDRIKNLLSPLQPSDIFYDVGCGDGRVLIHLAQTTSCRHFVGIEIDRERAEEARVAVRNAHLDPSVKVEIRCENALTSDYADATAVFLYLIPRGLRLIKPLLLRGRESVVVLGGDGGVAMRKEGHQQVEEQERLKDIENNDAGTITIGMNTSQVSSSLSARVAGESERIEQTSASSSCGEDVIQEIGRKSRPLLRVVTYMAGWNDVQHVTQELCSVEHQKGAQWPIYLYHFH